MEKTWGGTGSKNSGNGVGERVMVGIGVVVGVSVGCGVSVIWVGVGSSVGFTVVQAANKIENKKK